MSDIILSNLLHILKNLLFALFNIIIAKLIRLTSFKLKSDKRNKTNNAIFKVIQDSIDYVFQTYVDDLKKSNKFDTRSQKKALNKALNISLTFMKPKHKKFIIKNYGNLNKWIRTNIEVIIKKKKQN